MTKILFIDSDEIAFQIRQCIVRALRELPPVELHHASDATEALSLLENIKPDVIVLDEEPVEESALFLDSLHGSHPPVVVQTVDEGKRTRQRPEVTYITKNDSLDGVHQTLLTATTLATKLEAGAET